jgi:hypothetical protein
MSAIGRPETNEYPTMYAAYIEQCTGADLLQALTMSHSRASELLMSLPRAMEDYRYAPNKWTIKDVVQHTIDTELVFAYRALRFARMDATDLPGFEENDYARAAETTRRTLEELMMEADIVRQSTLCLYRSLTPSMLLAKGTANGRTFSVRALGWAIAVHELHHLHILQERYLDHGNS